MKSQTVLLITGLLAIAGGIFSFFNPLAATLTVEQLIAAVFVAVGVFQLWGAWQYRAFGSNMWLIISGLVTLLIGLYLLFNPLEGAGALTGMIAGLLLFSGISQALFSLSLRDTFFFIPTLLSGLISLGLAVMIFLNFPQSATAILGIFLAIELISNGISLLILSRRV